jgi:hypothetical protein
MDQDVVLMYGKREDVLDNPCSSGSTPCARTA